MKREKDKILFFNGVFLKDVLILLFFFAIILIPTFSSLHADPFFDDYHFIFKSPAFVDAKNGFIFWDNQGISPRSWPLSYTVLWYLHVLFGEKYFLYRLVNLFLHALNTLLILKNFSVFFNRKIVFFAALIFLVHPMQIETLMWIFQMKTLLATTFFLLSMMFFWKQFQVRNNKLRQGILYLTSILFFYFSLMSKSYFVLGFILYFCIYLNNKKECKRALLLIIPFIIIGFFSCYESVKGIIIEPIEKTALVKYFKSESISFIKLNVSNKNVVSYLDNDDKKDLWIDDQYFSHHQEHVSSHLGYVMLANLQHYLEKLLFPINLSFLYNKLNYQTLQNHIKTLFVLVFIFFLLFRFISRDLLKSEIFIFFLISYIPISGIIYIPYFKYSFVADHWFYASIFPATVGIISLVRKCSLFKFKGIYFLCSISVIVFFLVLSGIHAQKFLYQERLFTYAVREVPGEYMLYSSLINLYKKNNNEHDIINLYRQALEQKALSNEMDLLNNLGALYREQGEREKLEQIVFSFFPFYFNLGYCNVLQDLVKDFSQNEYFLKVVQGCNKKTNL